MLQPGWLHFMSWNRIFAVLVQLHAIFVQLPNMALGVASCFCCC